MFNSYTIMGKKKSVKNKSAVEFGNGNIPDLNLKVKKSLPEAARFTKADQNRKVKQGGQIY